MECSIFNFLPRFCPKCGVKFEFKRPKNLYGREYLDDVDYDDLNLGIIFKCECGATFQRKDFNFKEDVDRLISKK